MILGDPGRGRSSDRRVDVRVAVSTAPRSWASTRAIRSRASAILVPASGQLRGNPINGNEYVPPAQDDLQYACIFPLARRRRRECGMTAGCDCSTVSSGQGKPLCNGTEQTFAKAYPGLRHLQVLKGIGEQVQGVNNAIVASICPKITDRDNPAYGYNPAVAAIIER